MFTNAIWITGAKGAVGSYLSQMLERRGYEVLPTGSEVDVCDLEVMNEFALKNRPVVVINCAAIVGRAAAEEDPTEAYRVNTIGARNVAVASAAVGARIVHLSTDDVFSRSSRAPVNEFDAPVPDSIYGKSRLAGEDFVRRLNHEHTIVRSGWIYGLGRSGSLSDILQQAQARQPITTYTDQIGSPTSITTYANYIVALMEAGEYGTFHVSCAGVCSRFEFARTALEYAGLPTDLLHPTKDMEHAYHIDLDNLMLRLVGFEPVPNWHDDLRAYMASRGLLCPEAAAQLGHVQAC